MELTVKAWLPVVALVASMGAMGFRPSWVSVGAFLIAVLFYGSERLVDAYAYRGSMAQDAAEATKKYEAEMAELRKELKAAHDGFKQAISQQNLRKAIF